MIQEALLDSLLPVELTSKMAYSTKPRLAVLLLLLHIVQFTYSESARNELSLLNQCTCVGFNQTYECTIAAEGGATFWRGSAIDCPEIDNEIFLSHSPQVFTKTRGCNDRPIVAHGVRIEDNCYISRLNIMGLDLNMTNRSVQCFYSNGTSTLVGLSYIEFTKEPIPPPNDISISRIIEDSEGSMTLIFTWSPVIHNCSSLYYIIMSNCSLCPNETVMTTATCRGLLVGDHCAFAIQSVVCNGTIVGNITTVSVDLRVPDPPVISVVPTYSHTTGSLSEITTTFNELEKFNITNGLDGSATTYTIVYTDAASEMTCYSTTLPTDSACSPHCIYKHIKNFPLSNCSHSVSIQVSVYGTNVLGRGSPSNNLTIGIKNTFIEVTFEENFATATCKFLEWQPSNDEKYKSNCSIVYGYNSRFPIGSESILELSSSDAVVLNLSVSEEQFKQEYQFIVIAGNGSFTAQVIGTFVVGASQTSSFTVSGLVFGVSIGVLIAVILLISVISTIAIAMLIRRKNSIAALQSESVTKVSSPHDIDTNSNPAYELVQFRICN